MPELTMLAPREADQVVREPMIEFEREAASGDVLHGSFCICDIMSVHDTLHP